MLLAAAMLAMVLGMQVSPAAALCQDIAGVTCPREFPNPGCCDDTTGDCTKDVSGQDAVSCGTGLSLACCT